MKSYFFEGNQNRLFINTSVGCECKCKYCYLPKIGILDNTCEVIGCDDLLREIHESDIFKKGKNGTILSIGCYSECWSYKNVTIDLVKNLSIFENPIQLATKKEIESSDLFELKKHLKWNNQLSIFVSIPVINQIKSWELNTTGIKQRIETIDRCLSLNIPVYLYIKPVIKNVTLLDIDTYVNIIKMYANLEVVVGEMFVTDESKRVAPVGNGRLFYEEDNSDHEKIIDILNKITVVYNSSVDAVNKLRS